MKVIVIAVTAVGCMMLSGCFGFSNQNQLNALQRRLNQQQEELRQLKVQLASLQPAQADTWAQVQAVRQDIASIRGQMDDFLYETNSVGGVSGLAQKVVKNESALRKIEKQFDMKLLEGGSSSTKAGGMVGGAGISSGAGKSYTNKFGQTSSAAPVKSIDTSKALYESGVRSFNDKKYKEALKAFTDFTNTYSAHKLVGNAWFWRGEANYQLGKYASAALEYEQVISKYTKNSKIASAYLKQGLCFYKTKKKDAGAFRLEELIKKFPKSPEAKRAAQVLKEYK